MPYPPNYDNIWDITQPPDTQAANQLGLDIRNLKDDIMQRMALLSGNLSSRPTPEKVNANWGGASYGILFFAIDTKQIFQWSGTAWVEVTYSIGGGGLSSTIDFTKNNFVNASVYQNLNQVVIPSGVVGAKSVIEIEATIDIASGTATSLELTDNSGATLFGATYAFVISSALVKCLVFVLNSGQILFDGSIQTWGSGGSGVYVKTGTASFDLVNANTITMKGQSGGAGSITGTGMIAKVFH